MPEHVNFNAVDGENIIFKKQGKYFLTIGIWFGYVCYVQVKNLDTGTEMDLATAEEHLPQSINPLSLHIMRLTS